MSSCCSSPCAPAIRQFNAAIAERDLGRYRRKGPNATTRLLRDELLRHGGGQTVLDVGAGVGALSFELLGAGFQHATAVDASPAYVAAALQEAKRRDCATRFEAHEGDFVELGPRLPTAEVVVMDRVVCCYPAYEPLVRAALGRAVRVFAFSFPRDRWYVRGMIALENAERALRRNAFRAFVHPAQAMEALVEREGFRPVASRGTLAWQIVVFAREG